MNRIFVMVLVTLMLFVLAAASFRSSARSSELSKLYVFQETPTPTATPTPLPSPSPSTTPIRQQESHRSVCIRRTPAESRTEPRKFTSRRVRSPKTQKPNLSVGLCDRPGNFLRSHTLARAVPSGLRGLTSVFGMGTGGSLSLQSPKTGFVQRAGPLRDTTL